MNASYIIDPDLYQKLFYAIMLLLCLLAGASRLGCKNGILVRGKRNQLISAWVLFVCVALFIGLRPVAEAFGDTIGYARAFVTQSFSRRTSNGEWVWVSINRHIAAIGGNWIVCSLLVGILYVGGVFFACRRWFGENVYVAMLFVMSLFSFFSFGVNTIRNGLALSFVMAGMAIGMSRKNGHLKWHYIIAAIILFALGVGTHKTAILPVLCYAISMFVLKDIKLSLCVWVVALVLSLTIGNAAVAYIEELGFDDRLDRYIAAGTNVRQMAKGFSHTGFRWDFVLYGIMPIIMGWYVVVKKKIKDKAYVVLANTYILTNAFWLLTIRAAHTDRFAFLSWFIYGIVLAYPLLRLNVFRNHAKAMFVILMGCILSTWAFIIMWSLR